MSSFPSKTRKVLCGYCNIEIKECNLEAHCLNVHKGPKRIKGEKDILQFFGKSNNNNNINEIIAYEESQESSAVEFESSFVSSSSTTLSKEDTYDYKLDTIIKKLDLLDLKFDKNFTESIPSCSHDSRIYKNNTNNKNDVPSMVRTTDQKEILDTTMVECKSIQDLITKFECLEHTELEKSIICTLCADHSKQGANITGRFLLLCGEDEDEIVENETKQTRRFRNLKSHIKAHFDSDCHHANLRQKLLDEEHSAVYKSRSHLIGMRIGRICYTMYKQGSSLRNYETEILKSILNGTDIGDINHGRNFPSLFPPFVAE